MRTVSPACKSARSKSPATPGERESRAPPHPAAESARAFRKRTPPGRSNTRQSRQTHRGGWPPHVCPATSRPRAAGVDHSMTSIPGLYGRSGRTIMLPPVMRSRSFRLSGIACARTLTSPSPGSGISTRSSFNAVSGAPYSWFARLSWSFAGPSSVSLVVSAGFRAKRSIQDHAMLRVLMPLFPRP